MADQPTISIEEIARAFEDVVDDAVQAPGEGWLTGVQALAVAREHLRRVREVVERMSCNCKWREEYVGGYPKFKQVRDFECLRCTEIAALDAALAAGEPKG